MHPMHPMRQLTVVFLLAQVLVALGCSSGDPSPVPIETTEPEIAPRTLIEDAPDAKSCKKKCEDFCAQCSGICTCGKSHGQCVGICSKNFSDAT